MTQFRSIASFLSGVLVAGLFFLAKPAGPLLQADEKTVADAVEKAIKAAGGEDKLLKLFRIKELLVLNPDGKKKGSERISVLEPPNYWWVGKRERVKEEREPATFLVWAWSLAALTDPKSKIATLPEITDTETTLFGLRVSGTITPPLDIYFDKKQNRLFRIDWRNDIHRFSEWKNVDGFHYPSRTVGHRKTGKVWYQSDILEVTRLKELPKGLMR